MLLKLDLHKWVCISALCISLLALFVPSLLAQSGSTSALTGTVSDPTGARIPGVSVTATSVATNQSRSVLTAEDGVYRVPLLEPGEYRVRFTLSGFKTAEITGVNLVVTETSVLNHVLEVGAQAEQITVEAVAETIQTATSTIGTTVTGSQITSLQPQLHRRFGNVHRGRGRSKQRHFLWTRLAKHEREWSESREKQFPNGRSLY